MLKEGKIDIIVAWPDNCDYPLFRQWLKNNRDKFNDVFVVFTKSNTVWSYKEFVLEQLLLDRVLVYESPLVVGDQDWRDVAVNFALELSKAEWVLFLEQDFLIQANDFWSVIKSSIAVENADVIGFEQGERLHPAFLLCKREYVNRTKRNFGIVPNKSDHFGIFTQDLRRLQAKIRLLNKHLGLMEPTDWEHLNGLSHNHYLLETSQNPNYQIDRFKKYLKNCLLTDVKLDKRWEEKAESFV